MVRTKGRACDGKQAYSKAAAKRARWRLIRTRGALPSQLAAYRCGHCDHWHIGHR